MRCYSSDYEVLQLVNVSLLSEFNDFCYRCEDLEAELKKARSNSAANIAALEPEVKSAEAQSVEVAAARHKRLNDFEAELIGDLVELRKLSIRIVQSIRGICSPMPEGDSSVVGYIRWLSTEVTGFAEMFTLVNENFISAVVEGTLVMAGESVDLSALQDAAVVSGADILPMEQEVRKSLCVVSKTWWRSFGYDYKLNAIRVKLRDVTANI
jgi:hypothetical protein